MGTRDLQRGLMVLLGQVVLLVPLLEIVVDAFFLRATPKIFSYPREIGDQISRIFVIDVGIIPVAL